MQGSYGASMLRDYVERPTWCGVTEMSVWLFELSRRIKLFWLNVYATV